MGLVIKILTALPKFLATTRHCASESRFNYTPSLHITHYLCKKSFNDAPIPYTIPHMHTANIKFTIIDKLH